MEWLQFQQILQEEIRTTLKYKMSNVLKNSYPLIRSANYCLAEFAIINTLSTSELWTVRDISRSSEHGTASDILFEIDGNNFPISIKSKVSEKRDFKLLNSRVQVEEMLNQIENGNINYLNDSKVFNTPIISLEYINGDMLLCLKECKKLKNENVEWTVDLPKTASFKDDCGRSILTFSRKKGTIVAYDGFFDSSTIIQEKCSDINMILYKIIEMLQSEESCCDIEEKVQNEQDTCYNELLTKGE